MAWLAIDAGTSVIKTLLLDAGGRELAAARRAVAVSRPHPGHAEQEMDAVWDAVCATVAEVVEQAGVDSAGVDSVNIEGIVSTAQGDGAWLVNAEGEPTGPAILWNDGRAAEIVEHWRATGVLDTAFHHSGSLTYPGLPNAIWSWLAEHSPERLGRARWSLSCNGWLHLQFTGQIAADLSDASNPFLDLLRREYSDELLRAFGVEAYRHLLPPIVPQPQAPLRAQLAQRFGLRAGIPVVMAPYDILTTATGCGSVHAGEGCLILGTTLCAEILVGAPELDGTPAGTSLAVLPTGKGDRLYLRAMPTLTGCEALDWVASTLRVETLHKLSQLAATAAAGAGNLVFLPYLSPAGERSPFLAPAARGSLLGLSLEHTQAEIARAVFEGLSFVIRECLAACTAQAPARLTVCGGGSRSDLWCQMIADVCGCEVLRPEVSEVGARGAFLHGLVATGAASSLAEAVARCPTGTRAFVPEAAANRLYGSLFERFLSLRAQVRPAWDLMECGALSARAMTEAAE